MCLVTWKENLLTELMGKGMKGHIHQEVLKFNGKACLSDLGGR